VTKPIRPRIVPSLPGGVPGLTLAGARILSRSTDGPRGPTAEGSAASNGMSGESAAADASLEPGTDPNLAAVATARLKSAGSVWDMNPEDIPLPSWGLGMSAKDVAAAAESSDEESYMFMSTDKALYHSP